MKPAMQKRLAALEGKQGSGITFDDIGPEEAEQAYRRMSDTSVDSGLDFPSDPIAAAKAYQRLLNGGPTK